MESKGGPQRFFFFFVAHGGNLPTIEKWPSPAGGVVGFIASAPKREMKTQQFGGPRAEGRCLEPQTTIYKWMFGETTIFYVKIWNHPIETTIYKWLFGVPGGFPKDCLGGETSNIFYFHPDPWGDDPI